ncbi:MAG: 4Fe-4S dicluster domain-containing protein [Euryarchaeota archaeon]|nr:4Fe-4S dicluster domain-containing protein [Euryarchaeota archaeon]
MANSDSSNNFDYLYKKENKVRCLQCGRCAAGCPAAHVFSEYNPREVMRRVQDGEEHELHKDPIIWLCGQCYTCNSRCPRNNNPASIILQARERAYKQGHAPAEIYQQSAALLESLFLNGVTVSPVLLKEKLGVLSELVDVERLTKLRAELGLPEHNSREVPIPAKAIKQIRTIITSTSGQGERANDA